MAQLRLTTKGLLITLVMLSFVSFGLGFGVWQLAGTKTYDPTNSDAAGEGGPTGGCYEGPIPGCDNAQACDANGKPYCTNYQLVQCCDGSWAKDYAPFGDGKECPVCEKPSQVQQCWCKSFVGCGRDCTFPAGTQKNVDQRAAGSCKQWMAFCVSDSAGNTKIEIREAGNCWEERNLCKNPHAEDVCTPVVNVCEGGSMTEPVNSGSYDVGDTVILKGYAYDKDGINKNKIVVKVDGVVVGNATATDHPCASATADAACTAAKGSPVVDWTYTYTVTTAGAHSFSVSWEDTKGVTGASCQGSRNITANVQTNPSWEITKDGSGVCLDETAGNQRARVNYTISITNVGDGIGQLEDLVDTLDSKVQESYITDSSITPSASVSGRVITWDLSGSTGQFNPDQTKTFKYSIIVPESAFGTLTNTAVATPESGEAFQAVEIVTATCNPAEVPDTALFDSTASKVALGALLIIMSGTYLYTDGFRGWGNGVKTRNSIRKSKIFEDRVAGDL